MLANGPRIAWSGRWLLPLVCLACTAPEFSATPSDAGSDGVVDGAAGDAQAKPNGDGGGDASADDAGSAREDAGDGGGTGGAALALDVAPVVAAPGCVRVRVTRATAETALGVSVSGGPGSSFFVDPTCETPLDDAAFERGATLLDVFYAPTLAAGATVGTVTLVAQAGDLDARRTVEIRRRALDVVRAEDAACFMLADASEPLHCTGTSYRGRLGFEVDADYPLPTPSPHLAAIAPHARLAGGSKSMCALVLDAPADGTGAVRCWGENSYGQLGDGSTTDAAVPVAVSGLGSDVTQVSVGVDHACAVTSAGKAYCWGGNSAKQVADVGDASIDTATEITALAAAGVSASTSEIAAGWYVTAARTQTGDVYYWGNDDPVARPLPGLPQGVAKRVAASRNRVCAVTVDDRLFCWDGATTTRLTGIPSGTSIEDLQVGTYSVCAKAGGDLYCAGANPEGWLGTDSTTHPLAAMRRVLLPGKVERFAVAGLHSAEHTAIVDGLAYSWGFAPGLFTTSLGVELDWHDFVEPTRNPRLDELARIVISAGTISCGVTSGGAAQCWGIGSGVGNGIGDIEHGAFASSPTSVVSLGNDVDSVYVGGVFGLAVRNGQVHTWGAGDLGQLGTGSQEYAPSPVSVAFDGTIIDAAASGAASCVLEQADASTRKVWCWGYWGDSVVAAKSLVLSGGNDITDIDLSGSEGCAVIAGAVSCWNGHPFVITARADLSSDVVAISMYEAAGATPLCALKADHTAWCAFQSGGSVLTFEDVQSVRTGGGHACALERDQAGRSLLCAGSNTNGQLGTGDNAGSSVGLAVQGLSGAVSAYAVGAKSSCARDEDGWKCWGSNERGRLAFTPLVVAPTLVAAWQNP